MSNIKDLFYEPWPALPYSEFKSTGYLLHMAVQVIGKLKLHTPFEPHWSNVALWLTSRGLTTGLIPFHIGVFSVSLDFIEHHVSIDTSWGRSDKFDLTSMSVAQFTQKFFSILHNLQIDIHINPMPQEIAQRIAFDKDVQQRIYNNELANAWWHILIGSYKVMQRYHARFNGETPPIGLMWGTFDLRDARYNGISVPPVGINASYIRRNAMDEAQVEIGWWPGNESYQKPAFFSFIYPQPKNIEQAKIKPNQAHWDNALAEFILDYDDLRKSPDPDQDLLLFFESAYQAGASLAGWNEKLITTGEPV